MERRERKVVNVKDFPELEKELAGKFKEGGIMGNAALLEGPDTGIDFDPDTGKIKIANGWHADENGDIVKD